MPQVPQQSKRKVGRPLGSTTPGIRSRLERYQLHEQFAQLIDKYGPPFCELVMSAKPEKGKGDRGYLYTFAERIETLKLMLDRAYGRPRQSVQLDTLNASQSKIEYTVRWLPPDPNDTSVRIPAEPD